MPANRRRPDLQTDYEDPVDRLFRRREPRRENSGKPDKVPSTTAAVAFYFGMVGLIPCVGVVFGPLAVLLGFVGLAQTRDPKVSGKGKAKSGLWFGLIAVVINYLIPLAFYIWVGIQGGRF